MNSSRMILPAGRRRRRATPLLIACGVAAALAAGAGPASGANASERTPVPTGPAPGPSDARELEIYLDGIVPALMESHHVPGTVVVVVRDGAIFFARGYGHADRASRRPVDPATTLFRVASVSKLFTTTAVMQQVEAGRLDLDADVNDYLEDFKIESRFGQPLTLSHLLTHTAGFDDEYLRTIEPLDATPTRLVDFLAAEMPERVMPPGDLISYSNQGLALAGHLVERASGIRFETYIQDRILNPLGMVRSRFGIPNPIPPEIATGYEYRNGAHHALGYDRLRDGPAGDLITTGEEIARFMIMHLQLGALDGTRILEEATALRMQSRQFTHHPDIPGWCYGFYEGRVNGIRTLEHGGAWRGFGTELLLIPEHRFGLFVSTNLEYSPRFFRTLRTQFFDRYFPDEEPPPDSPAPGVAERLEPLAGSYLSVRRVRNSILKLGDFMGVYNVDLSPEGALNLRYPDDALPPMRLVEVEPRLFRDADGEALVTFRTADDGGSIHLLMSGGALEKMDWRGNPTLHGYVLLGAVILFVITALTWTLGFIERILVMGPPSPIRGRARFAAFLVCVLQSIFLVGMAIGIGGIDVYGLMERVPEWMKWMLALPPICVVLTLPVCYYTFRGYHKDLHSPLAMAHYGLITIAAVLTLVLEWHWNVLGYHF